MLCSTCYFPLFKGSIFLWQSDQSLLYRSNRMLAHFLKLPAEGSPGLLGQHKPSYTISQAFMVTVFPCSNTWWLHSEFLQDFGHTRARELQTTGWKMVVHQQYWHMDKPDSTGKHARSRGREVDCYHIRDFYGFRSLGQPTKCRYSQLSISQARIPECTDSHPPDPSR